MKYIRGRIGFAIFDEGQDHSKIARAMSDQPESAGMCTIAVGYETIREIGFPDTEKTFVSVHCFGESSTLKLKSRPEEDGEYLERQITRY